MAESHGVEKMFGGATPNDAKLVDISAADDFLGPFCVGLIVKAALATDVVKVEFASGASVSLPLNVGVNQFRISPTKVVRTGTTAGNTIIALFARVGGVQ